MRSCEDLLVTVHAAMMAALCACGEETPLQDMDPAIVRDAVSKLDDEVLANRTAALAKLRTIGQKQVNGSLAVPQGINGLQWMLGAGLLRSGSSETCGILVDSMNAKTHRVRCLAIVTCGTMDLINCSLGKGNKCGHVEDALFTLIDDESESESVRALALASVGNRLHLSRCACQKTPHWWWQDAMMSEEVKLWKSEARLQMRIDRAMHGRVPRLRAVGLRLAASVSDVDIWEAIRKASLSNDPCWQRDAIDAMGLAVAFGRDVEEGAESAIGSCAELVRTSEAEVTLGIYGVMQCAKRHGQWWSVLVEHGVRHESELIRILSCNLLYNGKTLEVPEAVLVRGCGIAYQTGGEDCRMAAVGALAEYGRLDMEYSKLIKADAVGVRKAALRGCLLADGVPTEALSLAMWATASDHPEERSVACAVLGRAVVRGQIGREAAERIRGVDLSGGCDVWRSYVECVLAKVEREMLVAGGKGTEVANVRRFIREASVAGGCGIVLEEYLERMRAEDIHVAVEACGAELDAIVEACKVTGRTALARRLAQYKLY